MRSDVFIAKLARGAIAASIASASLPYTHTGAIAAQDIARDEACANVALLPEVGTDAAVNQSIVLRMSNVQTTWEKKQEKEFRALALAEAKGTLPAQDEKRLDELTRLRNRLLHGQTAEEISLQLKRDRLVDRMESLLREYVEFQEVANQKRPTT